MGHLVAVLWTNGCPFVGHVLCVNGCLDSSWHVLCMFAALVHFLAVLCMYAWCSASACPYWFSYGAILGCISSWCSYTWHWLLWAVILLQLNGHNWWLGMGCWWWGVNGSPILSTWIGLCWLLGPAVLLGSLLYSIHWATYSTLRGFEMKWYIKKCHLVSIRVRHWTQFMVS